MNPRAKNVIAFVLAASFAFVILCSTFAAPGQALASVSGCSHTAGAMEMAGCEHPSYLCGFDPSSKLFFQGAFSSTRYDDLSKSAHDLSIGEVPFDASKNSTLVSRNSESSFLVHRPGKVSTRLLNSILNL
jgi:hypothetical protein